MSSVSSVSSLFSILKNSRDQRAASSRDVINTQISLAIVSLFILCHAVRWIPNMWELYHLDQGQTATPSWILQTSAISHLLTTLSSSVNWSDMEDVIIL